MILTAAWCKFHNGTLMTTLWKPYDDFRVVLWHVSKFGSLYYRQTVNYFKVAIKSSKSVHKTRNIAIGSSQSCGSGNKVVIALLQDVKKHSKTNTGNFPLLCNILETNSAKHYKLAIDMYTMQISWTDLGF